MAAAILPRSASAQGVLPAAGGATAGAVGGALLTAGALAIRAQDDLYIWDWAELAGWPAVPIVGGLVIGGVQGATDADSLGRGVLWGTVGAAAGAAAGWWLGPAVWEEPRARWAGLTAGLAGGLLTGWIVGSLTWGDDGPDSRPMPLLSLRIPL